MKPKTLLCAVLAAGLGMTAITVSAPDAFAQKKGKKTTAPAAPPPEPAVAKKAIAMQPAKLVWGMSVKQVAAVYDDVIDEDFKPEYKKVQPGVQMKDLDAQIAELKSQFRRSRIDFGKLPTGIDSTPLKGEYTYMNKEAMMSITRKGVTRNLFFIQDHLWKVIDEVKLGEGTTYGKDFQAAAVKLSAQLGVPGRVLPPDPAKGQYTTVVDWKDAHTHLRAIERGEASFAIAYEDEVTLGQLASLRTNKPAEESAIDPAVAAALMKHDPAPEPPKDAKKKH
jgi:hypothetical protein